MAIGLGFGNGIPQDRFGGSAPPVPVGDFIVLENGFDKMLLENNVDLMIIE
tara:strand:- start:1004 stop:1156 length:153 start_codon:yes stop_codon:yes gene_type:complete